MKAIKVSEPLSLNLGDYLNEKISQKKSQSLRSTARRMKVDPSLLSNVLCGAKPPTLALLQKVDEIYPMSTVQYRVLKRTILRNLIRKASPTASTRNDVPLSPSGVTTRN